MAHKKIHAGSYSLVFYCYLFESETNNSIPKILARILRQISQTLFANQWKFHQVAGDIRGEG